ncbi:MAG: glycosyltransferase family 2 protein [Candidatus Bathyarchaeia archaeon]
MAAVVVTFNRRYLLRECLEALLTQTRPLDEIIVVDNASTDQTCAMLAERFPTVTIVALDENLGGAGGFAEGIKVAYAHGHDWIWLLDDDAIPHPEALMYLLKNVRTAQNSKFFIGSLPRSKDSDELVWPVKVGKEWISNLTQIPSEHFEPDFLPFLGLLIPAQAVVEVGLPRADFFVVLDDVEYCYRAKMKGYTLIGIPASVVYHPMPLRKSFRLFKRTVFVESLPPWKGYYDIRNRILLSLEYEGLMFCFKRLPILLFRIILSLLYWGVKGNTLRLYARGLLDGLKGRTGKLVIPQ